MGTDETNSHPTWRDYEALVTRLASVVRSNTNSLRLGHAAQTSIAKTVAEAVSLCSDLKGSSAVHAERIAGKLDLLVEVARNAEKAATQAAVESRATNDKLGVTREEIGAMHRAITPPQGVPAYDETRSSPPEGITLKHGKLQANVKIERLERLKRLLPWLGPVLGGAGWHFIRHFFGF